VFFLFSKIFHFSDKQSNYSELSVKVLVTVPAIIRLEEAISSGGASSFFRSQNQARYDKEFRLSMGKLCIKKDIKAGDESKIYWVFIFFTRHFPNPDLEEKVESFGCPW